MKIKQYILTILVVFSFAVPAFASTEVLNTTFPNDRDLDLIWQKDNNHPDLYTVDETGFVMDASGLSVLTDALAELTGADLTPAYGDLSASTTYCYKYAYCTNGLKCTVASSEYTYTTGGSATGYSLSGTFPSDTDFSKVVYWTTDQTAASCNTYNYHKGTQRAISADTFTITVLHEADGSWASPEDTVIAPYASAEGDSLTGVVSNINVKGGDVTVKFTLDEASKDYWICVRCWGYNDIPHSKPYITGIFLKFTGGTQCRPEEIIQDVTYYNPAANTTDCADYDDGSEHTVVIDYNEDDIIITYDAVEIYTGTNALQTQTANNRSGMISLEAFDVKAHFSQIIVNEDEGDWANIYEYWNCNQRVQLYNYHDINDRASTSYYVPIATLENDTQRIVDDAFNVVSRQQVKNWLSDCTTSYLPENPFFVEHSEGGSGTILSDMYMNLLSHGFIGSAGIDQYRLGDFDYVTEADLEIWVDHGMDLHWDLEINSEAEANANSKNFLNAEYNQLLYDQYYSYGSVVQDGDGWPVFPIGGWQNADNTRPGTRTQWNNFPKMAWITQTATPMAGIGVYNQNKGGMVRSNYGDRPHLDVSLDVPNFKTINRLPGDYRSERIDLSEFINETFQRTDTHLVWDGEKIYLDWNWDVEDDMEHHPIKTPNAYAKGITTPDSNYRDELNSGTLNQYSSGQATDEYQYYWQEFTAGNNVDVMAEVELQVVNSTTSPNTKHGIPDEPFFELMGSGYISYGDNVINIYDTYDNLLDTKYMTNNIPRLYGLAQTSATTMDLLYAGKFVQSYTPTVGTAWPPGAVSVWEFESDVVDMNTVTGNDLSTVGSPGYTAAVVGNGINLVPTDYAQITDGSQTGLDNNATMTIGTWFNRDVTDHTEYEIILAKWGATLSYQILLGKDTSGFDDEARCYFATPLESLFAESTTTFTSTSTDYHLACRYDGAEITIWVNGVKEHTQACSTCGIVRDSDVNFRLGYRADDLYPFDGYLDDTFVYDRALTDAEMLSIANVDYAKGVRFGLSGGDSVQDVMFKRVAYTDQSTDTTKEGARHDYGLLGPITFLGNVADPKAASWVEHLPGDTTVHFQTRPCTDATCSTDPTWLPNNRVVFDNFDSSPSSCTASDGANTPCSLDTSIKNEGTGSLKVTTVPSSSNGDSVYTSVSAVDLTSKGLFSKQIRSSVAGCEFVEMSLGESSTIADASYSKRPCFDRANTWQTVYFDIGEVVSPAMVDFYAPMEGIGRRFDLSGNAKNLAENGTVIQDTAGKFDNAAEFDNNASNYLSVGSALPCSASALCTMTFYWNRGDTGVQDTIFDSDYLEVYVNTSDQYEAIFDGVDTVTFTTTGSTGGSTFDFVEVSYDSAGNASINMNNGTALTTAATQGTLATDATARFGITEGDANVATGSIDEVTFDNADWTAEQGAYFYNSGTGIDLKTTKPEIDMDAITHFFVKIIDDSANPDIWVDDSASDKWTTNSAGDLITGFGTNVAYFQTRFLFTTTDKTYTPSAGGFLNWLHQGASLTIEGAGGGGGNPFNPF